MKFYLLTFLIALLIFSGCTQSPPPAQNIPAPVPPIPDAPPVAPPTNNPPTAPVPLVEEPPAPIETPSGPQSITMSESPELKWTGGYADPSIVEFNGKYWMYLNRFSNNNPNQTGSFVLSSTDGIDWEEETGIIFPGVATTRAFVMNNGVRVYYPQGPEVQPGNPASIISSFSSNGKTFTKDSGIRIAPETGYTMDGPTVFTLKDGTFRLYAAEYALADPTQRKGPIYGATSTDGLTWTKDETPTLEAEAAVEGIQPWPQILHPFVLPYKEGYIMLYNSHSILFWAYSEDGLEWNKRGRILNNGQPIRGADSDGFFISENELRVYYGDFHPDTSGVVYTAKLRVE